MPQQVTRLGIAFAVLAIVFMAVRQRLVPDTFGEAGHYRAAAVDSIAAYPLQYAGHEECTLCHRPIAEKRSASNHSGVSCEVCHGPAAEHVRAPGSVKPPAPRERGFCPLCHGYDASRPSGFPQIDPVAHNPTVPCMSCHDPHAPEPPVVPGACRACHGRIASQKAVSHHAVLPCLTCHEAPDEHKVTPRLMRPGKPSSRDFCGGCHAEGAESPTYIPRIDMSSHGEGYLCWQCHYPHHPEAE
jgi:hypothetical protein